jgi:hypothetical protein
LLSKLLPGCMLTFLHLSPPFLTFPMLSNLSESLSIG